MIIIKAIRNYREEMKRAEDIQKRSRFLSDPDEPPVTSDAEPCLPTYSISPNDQALLTQFGVQFAPTGPDEWFTKVNLPDGWKIKVKNAWHYLLDGKDRVRAEYWYKPKYSPHVNHFSVRPRYSIYVCYPCDEQGKYLPIPPTSPSTYCTLVVLDSETVIYQGIVRSGGEKYSYFQEGMKAIDWLYQHFPLWWDVTAYWD